jgi:hypothetical protein
LQPAGFGYNDFGNTGNETNLPFFSSGVVDKTLGPDTLGAINYSGTFLAGFDPSLTFSIGIDVNMANGQPRQTLESFFFLDVTDQKVISAFINRTDGNLFATNNGTGFPDMTLTGLSLLSTPDSWRSLPNPVRPMDPTVLHQRGSGSRSTGGRRRRTSQPAWDYLA